MKPEGQPSNGSPKPGGSRMQGQGSGQQGHNLVGESPIVSIDRFRHVAIPQFVTGNLTSIAGRPGDTELQRWVQPGGLASMVA